MSSDVNRRSPQFVCSFAALALSLFAAGCSQQEQVTSYSIPKQAAIDKLTGVDAKPRTPPSSTAGQKGRMLAALVPHGEKAWFFKLTGPVDAVGEQFETFRTFLQSIHFAGAEPKWTLPKDWEQQPGSGLRYATLRITTVKPPLEMTVISLPKETDPKDKDAEQNYVLSNVNRWRGQLSLPPLLGNELLENSSPLEVDGATATLVDFEGKLADDGMSKAPFASGNRPPRMPNPPQAAADESGAKQPAKQLRYKTPPGWDEGQASGMRKATFSVQDGDKKAEITAIDLEPSAGDLLPNVNRWRKQIKLDDMSQADLDAALKTLPVGSAQGQYIELVGSKDAAPRQSILGVIAVAGGRAWFFKLLGDSELAEREKKHFEEFVHSITFTGSEGAADGK
jgi:hypothetical protein